MTSAMQHKHSCNHLCTLNAPSLGEHRPGRSGLAQPGRRGGALTGRALIEGSMTADNPLSPLSNDLEPRCRGTK